MTTRKRDPLSGKLTREPLNPLSKRILSSYELDVIMMEEEWFPKKKGLANE